MKEGARGRVGSIVLLVQMQELPPGYNDSAIDKILKAAQSELSAFSLVALPCESILIVYPTGWVVTRSGVGDGVGMGNGVGLLR